MNKVYFYPNIDYKLIESPNPYIANFEKAISVNNYIVNKKYNKKGVLDFFFHFFQTDFFVFNWIEDLPFYRYGKIQTLFFIFFLGCSKIARKKIVWVLHNKYTHNMEKNRWTDLMFSLMMRYSDLILTHSSEGVSFSKKHYPKYARKVKYIIHPVSPPFPEAPEEEKKVDLLLWGTVTRYKGIASFLAYLKKVDPKPSLTVWIVGRCFQDDYRAEIQSYVTENILFKEAFYELEEIAQMARQARFILFTHQKTSVLSSGVLMDSIRMRTPVLGPDIGAFHDLEELGLVMTYRNFNDIIDWCMASRQGDLYKGADIEQFYKDNSWEQFATKLDEAFDILNNKKLATQYVWN
jgi:glycosyltransferase involved in cell wall biosynthesis